LLHTNQLFHKTDDQLHVLIAILKQPFTTKIHNWDEPNTRTQQLPATRKEASTAKAPKRQIHVKWCASQPQKPNTKVLSEPKKRDTIYKSTTTKKKKQLNPTLPPFWFLNLWFLFNNNNNIYLKFNNNNNNNNKTHTRPNSLGPDENARPKLLGSGVHVSLSNLILEPLSSPKLLGSRRASQTQVNNNNNNNNNK